MANGTLTARCRYRFDEFMSKGTVALIFALGAISLLFIVVMAAIVVAGGIRPEGQDEGLGFFEAAWMSLMRTLDSGTMGGDAGWGFRIAMLVVTLGGIFIISTLIGLLTSGIESKLDDLRKGRSEVIEDDHTVILGWSQQIFTIVSEIIEANANKSHACIVILSDRDKTEMEDELASRVTDRKSTKLVCRSGSPIDLNDLTMVSLNSARSIIVLSPEEGKSDTRVIQTILAITNSPGRRKSGYHIVAELRDPKSVEVARMVGRDEVELVLAGDLIARIIAQTCRQSGLSVVYTELLDFGGDEIYFHEEKALVGSTFGEALSRFETSTVLGLHRGGKPMLNPPMDTKILTGDKLVMIAEDDSAIQLAKQAAAVDRKAIQLRDAQPSKPERTLILGWNWRAPWIIRELNNYVAPGSHLTVVSTSPDTEAELAKLDGTLSNYKIELKNADTTDRATLNELNIPSYEHVIILCYDNLDEQASDASTLITLLHLRDMASKLEQPFSIVTEMLDLRNRALAEVAQPDDFVVSEKLISLMLAQVSENKQLQAVFADIFDPEGSEIYLKPATDYVTAGTPVNFYTITEAARAKNEVALGYRIRALSKDKDKAYGVRVNPAKGVKVTLSEGDNIIVLAEN